MSSEAPRIPLLPLYAGLETHAWSKCFFAIHAGRGGTPGLCNAVWGGTSPFLTHSVPPCITAGHRYGGATSWNTAATPTREGPGLVKARQTYAATTTGAPKTIPEPVNRAPLREESDEDEAPAKDRDAGYLTAEASGKTAADPARALAKRISSEALAKPKAAGPARPANEGHTRDERDATLFLEAMIGDYLPEDTLQESCKTGELLCDVANKIKAGCCKKPTRDTSMVGEGVWWPCEGCGKRLTGPLSL